MASGDQLQKFAVVNMLMITIIIFVISFFSRVSTLYIIFIFYYIDKLNFSVIFY